MTQALLDALKALDAGNENHWTSDGMPRLETVKFLSKDSTVTRDSVNAAAPGFSRANAAEYWAQAGQGATQTAGSTQGATEPTIDAPGAAQGAAQGGSDGTQDPSGALSDAQAEQAVQELDESRPVESDPDEFAKYNLRGVSDKESAWAAVERARAAHVQTTRALAAANEAHDRYAQEDEKSRPREDVGNTIREYLNSQQRIGDQRAAKMEAMRGVPIKELLPTKAKIDEAFSRRRSSRDNQRPTHPKSRA